MAPGKYSRKRKQETENLTWQQSALLYLHDLIYMLSVIMVVFLLLFRMVVVSGPSMYATLWDGDWLLVLSSIFYQNPEKGDIIIASKQSYNSGEPIVKRVIATEGQKVDIDFEAGIVYVNDVALEEDYTYTMTKMEEGMSFPLIVSEGCVFAMGDNRNRSRDSRYPDIGLIDKREILGKAVLLIYPGVGEAPYGGPRDYNRIGVLN